MNSVMIIFVAGLVFSRTGLAAENLQINLKKDSQAVQVLNIYDLTPKQASRLTSISKLKYLEIQKKWKDCSQLAEQTIKSQSLVAGWVATSWFNCSLRLNEGSQKPEKNLVKPVDYLQKNIYLLDRGPWKSSLSVYWIRSLQILIDTKSNVSKKALSWAFLRPELLSPDSRNSYLEKLQNQTWSPSAGAKKTYALNTPDAELEMSQNLESLWSQKKKENLAEPIVKYLLLYPNGKFQKLWRDRLVDSYNSFWDQKSAETAAMMIQILKLDGPRLADIAQNWHRRANYADTLTLVEEALKKSPSTTSLQWMAARSALFLGSYEKAKAYFEILVEKSSGTDEGAEGLFRLGLLHFRIGNPQQAQIYFARLLATGRDRGELNTRYWYVRSLQATNSNQAELERDQLIEDYPYSYYGLKLLAEKNNGIIDFEKKALDPLPEKITLAGDSVATWKRAKALLKAGWWIEANSEVNDLPWSQNATQQLAWAQWMAANKLWPSAIRLVNQAFEQSPSLKNWDALKDFFPKDYLEIIKSESEKRKLSPRLVQSLIRQESAFGLKAASTSNALGLMQMIQPTAQDVARQMKINLQWPDDMYLPQTNVPMGVMYISQMIDEMKGHIPLALACYNAGPVRMKLWLASRPDTANLMNTQSTEIRDEIWMDELPWNETSFYVKAILRNILLYQMSEEKNLTLKPAFWADLSTKTSKTP